VQPHWKEGRKNVNFAGGGRTREYVKKEEGRSTEGQNEGEKGLGSVTKKVSGVCLGKGPWVKREEGLERQNKRKDR